MEKTTEFARWFGRSKIVNVAGLPIIVFHGTQAGCDRIHQRKRKPDLGFHFGSLSQAEWFAGYDGIRRTSTGSTLIPAYLRIERPLCMPDVFERGIDGAENVADWLHKHGILGPAEARGVFRSRTAPEAYRRLICAIEQAGYDGIIYENIYEGGTATTNENSCVVFRVEQIWSLLSRGAFHWSNKNTAAWCSPKVI